MKVSKPVIIGIDEVGRGALAGPVTVAALALPQKSNIKNQISKLQFKNKKLFLKDSKKLTSTQREIIFRFLKREKIPYAVSSVSPKIIDKINISQAANLAATRAFQKLLKFSAIAKNFSKKDEIKIFLDGGLYINKSKIKNPMPTGRQEKSKLQFKSQKFKNIKIKTVIKGDEKIKAISLASIVAKVHRDKLMKKLHKKYPRYNFIHNVGYGVEKHRRAVKKYGYSPTHRRSFKIS